MEQSGYIQLRRRLMLAMLAFSLVPLFALGIFSLEQFTDIYTQKTVSSLEAVTEAKRRALDTFIKERLSQIQNIAATQSIATLSNQQELATIFSAIQSNARAYIDIGVIDNAGKQIAYVGPYNLTGITYTNEVWFEETKLKGQYISNVFLGFRNHPHFIIAVVHRDKDQSWIIRATIDSAAISTLLKSSYAGLNSNALLLNAQGLIQAQSTTSGTTMEHAGIPILSRGTRGVRVVEVPKQHDTPPTIAGMAWLKTMPWLLVVMEAPHDSLTPLEHIYIVLALFLLVGTGIIYIGTNYTIRIIVNRLKEHDRKQVILDSELVQSSKMAALGKLAAGVAHEVNNPLMLIRESAGWMKDLLSEENAAVMHNHRELIHVADKIEMHVDRAKTVTHRMLGLARRLEPVQDDICINSLTEQTIKFLETEARHRNITITKELESTLPNITTDAPQIQQVLLNVLDNAIDAIGHDGTIIVTTQYEEEQKGVVVRIKDSGAGIPPEVAAHIFDPFYTTKKRGEGTGLGLSICHTILEKLGGHISVESIIGEGATFTIVLPLTANQGATHED